MKGYHQSNTLWKLMIQESTRNGSFSETVSLYSSMLKSNIHGDNFTFPFVAKSCGKLGLLVDGMKVHAHSILLGFQSDAFVQTSLVDMYSKCSKLADSRKVFDEMPKRNLVSWNSMIHAYSSKLDMAESFGVLNQMRGAGAKPNSTTFVGIISGCDGPISGLKHGNAIHCYGIKVGVDSDVRLMNAILSMYLRFDLIGDARSLFVSMKDRSNVTWTAMMGGYARKGDFINVFDLFKQMVKEGIQLDSIAFLNLIAGCVSSEKLCATSMVHALLIKTGFDCEQTVAASLINLYAKHSDLSSAKRVFYSVYDKDISSWTSMIGGYVQAGKSSEALILFEKLLSTTSLQPNEVTIITILSACADTGSLAIGEKTEKYIREIKVDSDLRVLTSLIHMYCKCGSLERAKEIFDGVATRDLALWSSMINGYACHGKGEEALALFKEMQREGSIKPDAIVFTDVLTACSRSGLVEEGLKCFHSMQKDYGIEHSLEHYLCIVDLLGRIGDKESALSFLHHVPIQARNLVLALLLSACRNRDDVQLGEYLSKELLEFKSTSSGNYVLMANVYASLGKWMEASMFRRLMDKRGLIKEPGWSRIETSC